MICSDGDKNEVVYQIINIQRQLREELKFTLKNHNSNRYEASLIENASVFPLLNKFPQVT